MAVGQDTSAAGAALNNIVRDQSWFQERAKLVTSGVGFLATVAAWAATQPFATHPGVQMFILVAGFLATVVGVGVTPNGFTKSQLEKVNREQGRIIGSTKLADPDLVPAADDGEDLDSLVAEYNQRQVGL